MTFLSTLLLSVLVTIVLIPVLRALAGRMRMVDLPGERKVHKLPIPRIGGIAMAIGAFVPIVYWNHADPFVRAYLSGAAIIVAFGIVDDCKDLRARWKLLGQIAAALVVVFLGGVQIRTLGALLPDGFVLPGWVSVPLTLLAIVGVTNAINLADGLDGLAGGICLLIFCCIGYLAWLEEDVAIGLVSLALAGAIYGFLRFNTHPATVFMGDTGSQLLGFSAIALSLRLTQGSTALSPVLPLVLVGLPVLDTLSVMTVRVAKRRSIFSSDRNHIHHNLIALGMQQGESVVAIYACQTFLVLSAFMLRFHSDWLLLGGYAAFCAVAVLSISVANRNGGKAKVEAAKAEVANEPLRDYFGSRFLRRMKDEGAAIRYFQPALEYGFLLILVAICLVPSERPFYVSSFSLGFLAILLGTWGFKRDRLGDVLRIVLYLMIPVIVYKNAIGAGGWMTGVPTRLYNAAFVLLAVADIAVTKFSKRKEGFKGTPLDFLIVALAVVAPNLPEQNLKAYHLGLVAAQTIILYFSVEVLMAELRGEYNKLALGAGAALLVLGVKGFI